MLKSQWSKLYWTSHEHSFDHGCKEIILKAFDKEQYPILQEHEDLHYLEIMMLAYAIILADDVRDDLFSDILTGEVLFESFEAVGNIELGIDVLIKKGWLIGESNEYWRDNVYEVNFKKLVEDGMLTSCERPEISEAVHLPIELAAYRNFGAHGPFVKSWSALCYQIYWYAQKQYDWVVYKSLEKLCRVFMDLWEVPYDELRLMAIAYDRFRMRAFTEEEFLTYFPEQEVEDGIIQEQFEKLVGKGLFEPDGLDEEQQYLFKLNSKVESDLTRNRLHYDEAEETFQVQASAMPVAKWKEMHEQLVDFLTVGVGGLLDGALQKDYPVLRYMDYTIEQLTLLSYFVINEAMEDERQNKFFNLSDVTGHFLKYALKHDLLHYFSELSDDKEAIGILKAFEDKIWISILTSTYETEHYIKVKMHRLIEEGLLYV